MPDLGQNAGWFGHKVGHKNVVQCYKRIDGPAPLDSSEKQTEAALMEKMPELTKVVLINGYTVVTLIWCYFKGYSLTAILIAGFMLLGVANIDIYLRRR